MPKTKDVKRWEAEERQNYRDSRSPRQQLEVLKQRGVTSGKEFDKLARKINGN